MKKVLIITYYWPPAGGPGVQRVLKFVKYLFHFGWEPIVLTVEKGEYPAIDESLFSEIPPDLKVYKTKTFEFFSLYKSISGHQGNIPTHVLSSGTDDNLAAKIAKWIRANIMLPDARIGWIPSIKKAGREIINKEKPDLIFSSSPPHSLQIGAMKLAKETKIKWIADLRDPWRNAFWQKDIKQNRISAWIDERNEKKVLSSADAVITVSRSLAENFKGIAQNEYHIITNGFDEADFMNIKKSMGSKFRINYAGTLSKDQKITNLIDALISIPSKLRENIEINFYGSVHSSITKEAGRPDLKNLINIKPGINHDEIIDVMMNSEILLLVIPDTENNLGIVTGKIFEYLATGNFILGIGPKKGDASEILRESGSGEMFGYNDDLSDILLQRLNIWKTKQETPENKNRLEEFTRKKLTEKLARIFTEAV